MYCDTENGVEGWVSATGVGETTKDMRVSKNVKRFDKHNKQISRYKLTPCSSRESFQTLLTVSGHGWRSHAVTRNMLLTMSRSLDLLTCKIHLLANRKLSELENFAKSAATLGADRSLQLKSTDPET